MSVRAKFWVSENKPSESTPDEARTISLTAVYDGSEENKEYWRLTPAGFIQLSTINAEAAAQFEVGKQFYVTFEEAE